MAKEPWDGSTEKAKALTVEDFGMLDEIGETEEDRSKSFPDLREFYIRYAKTHFQGKKYRNKDVDEDILVSRDGLDKLEGMLSFREQCVAIQLLDQFLLNSTVEGRESDKKKRWNVDEFIYLACHAGLTINHIEYALR
ncbi:hypothetical protein FACS189485_20090 [Spirochaetia bacterium]|nr:hypothetical protein FACS189485_20090 [Spirochaetia bacterium]